MDKENTKPVDELSNDSNNPSTSTSTMGPPKFPSSMVPNNFNTEESATKSQALGGETKQIGVQNPKIVIPYTVPAWSHPPGKPYFLEVLKDGSIIEQLDVSEKGAYMFGRIDLCDFVLEHPTISRFHAVLQFKEDGEATIYDLGSTHGISINKKEVRKKEYTKVNVGDVIRFGQSSRLYIFQGPSDLMPPEGDLEKLRGYKALREEMVDREASLTRAKIEASLADGISWGMAEDAIEESIDNDAEEITWQTYKGQLTERQEKTRGKVIKRMEKVANMKKEIDAIRVKDISQGGLTQGQQTQIARNEQRMSQIMEELESLEETLNESIQESLGARSGKVVRNKKVGLFEEEDENLSDNDDFYDRTKKKSSSKTSNEKSVETADSLLNKKDAIVSELEAKNELLQKEKDKLVPTSVSTSTTGDDLDAYMNDLSSQLVINQTRKIEKEISDLQSELDRILYLLNIADPIGDAARKRETKAKSLKPIQAVIDTRKPPQLKQRNLSKEEKPKTDPQVENPTTSDKVSEAFEKKEEKTATAYIAPKPQWLGDIKGVKSEENHAKETVSEVPDSDNFIDYKDRKKVLASVNNKSELENAGPGLFVRKRKPVDNLSENSNKSPKVGDSTSCEVENTVVDDVALLLKHKRGYGALDDETRSENKDSLQPKRVLGPSKPDFLERSADYETWVPPKGQTGDGRTSLNDRLGY